MYDLNQNFLQNFDSETDAAKYLIKNKLTNCKVNTIRTHIGEAC